MDENEYRHAYNSINDQRCVFEKSILTLNCHCRHHEKFNLAEREGVRCKQSSAHQRCKNFLDNSRAKARFALQLTNIVGNLLPHSKEIQVQKGALLGLQPDLPNQPDTPIDDIYALIEIALQQSDGDLQQFDYQPIIASISHHPVRQRLRRKKSKR